MLDTLLLIASLHHPPVGAKVMAPAPLVQIRRDSLARPESLGTCYQNASGSCWSDR